MTVTGTDDQGAYVDTGVATLPTQRPSTDVPVSPPVVVDTGASGTKPAPNPRRPSGQRR